MASLKQYLLDIVASITSLSDTVEDAVPTSQKGVAGGVAPLDSEAKIPVEHMPTGWNNVDGGSA